MENRYYGEGDIIESATGYLVKVGEPVFDDKVTADEYGVAHILVGGSYAIENDTQYLVTLEVNGESKMYRELWMSGNADTANEVALSDYTFTMDEGFICGLTEDDVVIARFEPVEVYTTDAFRAAVSKTAPKSEGGSGGGGGGALVVNVTDGDGGTFVADKSMSEVLSAITSGNPVLCRYNSLISFFAKEEDLPEVYTSISITEPSINEQGLGGLLVRMYYFEYAEDGTFSGSKSVASLPLNE